MHDIFYNGKRKPLIGTPVNKHHPISKGLIACFPLNEFRSNISLGVSDEFFKVKDYVSGKFILKTNAGTNVAWGRRSGGAGIYCDGSQNVAYFKLDKVMSFLSRDMTVLIRHEINLDSANQALFNISDDADADRFILYIMGTADRRIRLTDDINDRGYNVTYSASGWNQYNAGWNAISDTACVIGKSRGRIVFKDGVAVGSNAYYLTGPEDITPVDGYNGIFGVKLGGGAVFGKYSGIYHHIYIWNRALSDEEIYSLWITPYLMFQQYISWALYKEAPHNVPLIMNYYRRLRVN